MDMDLKIKNKLAGIIKQSPILNDLDHAEATLKWLLYLRPDSDMALQIAAFGHDIDRGVNKITEKDRPKDTPYELFKKTHAKRSAEILSGILEAESFDETVINKVVRLVKKHEVGGDEDAELLKDADSIAYFNLNIPIYLERNGEEKTRHKIHFMFDRASARAQKIIRDMKFGNTEAQRLMNEEILIYREQL